MGIHIGIPLPTSADLAYNENYWHEYANAVREAGGDAVAISLSLAPAQLREDLFACDGFVLPGSPADVDPARYGQARDESTADGDDLRDACDLALLEHATAAGKPVLAICYGMQQLNVWRGGTLVQDILPVPVNHAAGAGVAIAHTALVAGQSLLASLLSSTEAPLEGAFRRLPVNSSHHQAVALPGDDLTVVARCGQDGVIEAVEGCVGAASVVGIQWHPERSTSISSASRALFAWLVAEAEDQQMQRDAEGAGPHAF